jgi:S1-C subfamily serine protease
MYTHRAIVNYSDSTTGDIHVKIPSVTGLNSSDLPWVVPDIGEQIIVTSDDVNFTNVFWVQTDPVINLTAFDLDGGTPSSIYGGVTSIDCGGV